MKSVSRISKLLLLTVTGLIVSLVAVWTLSPVKVEEEFEDSPVNAAGESDSISGWKHFVNEHFAGDESCKDCHSEEFEAHQRSGHSHTAVMMQRSPVAEILTAEDYQDPRRDQVFQFEEREGLIYAGILSEGAEPTFPVHWVLGSGSHAQTPVSIDPVSGLGVEFRWSWFAHLKKLGVTPDHERFDDYQSHSLESFGRPLDKGQALACVQCHMTVVPPETVPPTQDAFLPNVGCERCHGPRKEHVELALLGRADESKPLLTYDDPISYLKQCAGCHRDENNIPAGSSDETLARYQPYGLMKSACYLKSSNKMTCSQCHDPHDQAATSPAEYVAACLSCHQSPEQVHCSLEAALRTSSEKNCIDCHMPAVEWHSGIKFHDHWIRIPTQESE